MKEIKYLTLILLFITGLLIMLLLSFGLDVWSLIYWWVVIFVISLIWHFRLGSGFSLWLALSLFVLSALLTSISLRETGEIFMRLSFLGWIIGLIQAMIEYVLS